MKRTFHLSYQIGNGVWYQARTPQIFYSVLKGVDDQSKYHGLSILDKEYSLGHSNVLPYLLYSPFDATVRRYLCLKIAYFSLYYNLFLLFWYKFMILVQLGY
jgi:hypothetical protein